MTMPYIQSLIELAHSRHTIWLFSHDDGTRLKDIGEIRGRDELHDKTSGKIIHNRNKWYKLLHDLNLEYRPLKNCRHTYTMAMMDRNDRKITVIADILGHNNTDMIIKHYAGGTKGKALDEDDNIKLY